MMQDAIDLLVSAGEHQKRLFYSNFLSNNKVGEIICVQCDDSGDTYMFERWSVTGLDFVVAFRLLSEDSMIVADMSYQYQPIQSFVDAKESDNRRRFEQLETSLKEKRNMTIEEYRAEVEASGRDASFLRYEEFTRDHIEDRIPPGKKTIQGDRNSCIVVLERQKDIPNDLQRARLNEYVMGMPDEILQLMNHENDDEMKGFSTNFLKFAPKSLGLSTTLPFFIHTQIIKPTIYAFPEKEVDVERELGR
jgi:hypothetical protein